MRTFATVLCLAAAILAETTAAAPLQERAALSMSEICPTWEAQCLTACSAISADTVAKSSCVLSSRVTKRAGMSCKCGTKDLTSSVLTRFLTGSTDGSSSGVDAANSGSLVAATATLERPSIVAGAEATLLVSPSDLMPVALPTTTHVVAFAGGAKLAADETTVTPTESSSSAQPTSTSTKKTKKAKKTKTKTKTKTSSTSTPTTSTASNKVNAYIESAIPIFDAW